MKRSTTLAAAAVLVAMGLNPAPSPGKETTHNAGMLEAFRLDGTAAGACPLKHTEVTVEIAGLTARVHVTQTYHNPFDTKIEAIYTFPLSEHAAVDDMTMTVGDRTIRGQIKPRDEARQIYEHAKAAGHVASLLDQERPNIFTQAIANIEPGERVVIRISYVETLPWREGLFTFAFPMVVGPRYMPGSPTGLVSTGFAPDTDRVPDASRISPPVTPQGTRAGHDIGLTVQINAGLTLQSIESKQHEVNIEYLDSARTVAAVTLKNLTTIPNRDFVLELSTANEGISDALLTHTDERGQFFTLILQPPKRVPPQWIVPREVIFVIDKSGSMRGFPIETAKNIMARCIDTLKPADTFNLMTFSGGVGFCFDEPVANTAANRQHALAYLKTLQGGGGTEMMKAVNACLARQEDPERIRVVCFMTDGYVGNDLAIIEAVEQNAGTARVVAFGIGSSVNRFLLDGLARAGRGAVEYVLSPEQCEAGAERFYRRINTPVLTDVEIDWGDFVVEEIYPQRIPDLWDSAPVVIKGRYLSPGVGTITLRGRRGDGPFERTIELTLPENAPENDSVATLWARAKIENLMNGNLAAIQRGQPDPLVKEQIVGLGVNYRLMTQFTSFVAVEELTFTRDGVSRTIVVPVEMPAGVSYEGVFGDGRGGARKMMTRCPPLKKRGPARAAIAIKDASAPSERPRMPTSTAIRRDGDSISGASQDEAEEPLDAVANDPTLTAEQKRQRLLDAKLDAALREATGKVEVAVYLTDLSDETLAKLEALGLDILAQTKTIKMVLGVIEAKKLEALALLEIVRRVEKPKFASQ
ncbi:MAG: VWA domain-containing protein [Planctomycetes bacterium]|nr:VWA domain-containing protein [Planctomycetota bacterium]